MPGNLGNLIHAGKAHESAISSLWISANAGSGKTYVLTQQVVKLLLLGVPPERICCITYTKAAASEMRSRVIARLRELLLANDAECKKMVETILEAPASTEIMARARLLFGTVLDSMSGGIQLTTIHGFCQHLLRAFPLEAGIPPHFTVADDAQSSVLMSLTKHRLLSSERAADGSLAEAIALVADRSGEQAFDSLLKTIMNDRDLWREAWAGQTEETYRSRLQAAFKLDPGIIEQTLIQQCLGCLSESEKAVLRAVLPALQQEKTKYKSDFGLGVAAWLEAAPEHYPAMVDDWLNLWLTKTERTPISNLQKFMAAHPDAELARIYGCCRDLALRLVEQRAALALAEESFAVAIIARQVIDLYDQVKSERAVLDYDDLIARTRELLTTRDMVGWVMAKLDHRLDHLLIDEAQDTSAEQWRIAHALVDDLVATSQSIGAAGVPRSLFVVGDEKQSIFSFQGAAPELYAEKKTAFETLLEHSYAPLSTRQSTTSYRSAKAVLTVVDQLAQQPAVRAALSATGEPPLHGVIRKEPGQVVIHPPIPPQAKAEHRPFTIPTEYQITASAAQSLSETVARQVKHWLDGGEWRAGDILILIQKRTFILPLLRALQRADIPVAGIDRLVLGSHLAVKDLLALMSWTSAIYDDLALAQVLRSPLIGISEDELFTLAHDRGQQPLWQRVEALMPAHYATLNAWRNLAHASPYDFLACVLEADGTRKQFATRFGNEVHEILDELKEQAAYMPANTAPTLMNFVGLISGSDRQIKRELEQGDHQHVRIMTAHGSKGLEAPCVLLVDTVRVPDLRLESQFETRDAAGQLFPLMAFSAAAKNHPVYVAARADRLEAMNAEYYRLLYVAATRAQYALHVFSMEPRGKNGKPGTIPDHSWYALLRESVSALPHHKTDAGAWVFEDKQYQSTPGQLRHLPDAGDVPAWATTVPPALVTAPTLSPSRLAAAPLAPFAKQRGTGAKERGVRLHRILQFMDAGMDRAQLAQLIAHLAPDWAAKEQSKAEAEIWALMQAERWLWEHPAQAEVNISGTITINEMSYPVIGQIDRLIHTPEAVVVLDYKTGRDIPAEAEVSEAYLLQLKLYVALLETLYPGKKVRPAILWTAGPQLMWLDGPVKALLWDRVQLSQAA